MFFPMAFRIRLGAFVTGVGGTPAGIGVSARHFHCSVNRKTQSQIGIRESPKNMNYTSPIIKKVRNQGNDIPEQFLGEVGKRKTQYVLVALTIKQAV